MDYSSLNNMLNNLEVNQSNDYVDNKKAMTNTLQRDISLNQNKVNVELINPQRMQNTDTDNRNYSTSDDNAKYQKFDKCNSMINNYNFAFGQRTVNPNQFIDFTKINTQETKNKNNINDRLNNRGFTPSTSNKFFN